MILYRLLSPLIGLIVVLRSLWAVARGTETLGDLRERVFGAAPKGPVIWIHGASLGEMNAAKPVITALSADHHVLVSTTTTTGRATVKAWGLPRVTASLAPLDWSWVSARLMRRARIKALIIVENELWPNRICAAHAANRPVLMINARMSASSARTWGRFANLALRVLGPMRLIAPQDRESAARLASLGAKHVSSPLNLKGLYAPTLSAIPPQLSRFKRSKTVLAAATHSGEEAIVLAAFRILRNTIPDAQLILAPRHPARGAEVAEMVTDMGLSLAYRSSDDLPDSDVYLADTIGDMHLWYRLSGVAFIGGSLVDKGGHTPFEPSAYGCPILHGPHVDNFADSYAQLATAKAATPTHDAASLATAMRAHLCDDAMAARAAAALQQPDLAPLLAHIRAALNPDLQTRD